MWGGRMRSKSLTEYFKKESYKIICFFLIFVLTLSGIAFYLGARSLNLKASKLVADQLIFQALPAMEFGDELHLNNLIRESINSTNLTAVIVSDSKGEIIFKLNEKDISESEASFDEIIESSRLDTIFRFQMWFDDSEILYTLFLTALGLLFIILFFAIIMTMRMKQINKLIDDDVKALRVLLSSREIAPGADVLIFKETKEYSRVFINLLSQIEKQNKELKSLDSFISKFKVIRQITHDIKTPLIVLKAATSDKTIANHPEWGDLLSQSVSRLHQIVAEFNTKLVDDKKRESHEFHPVLVVEEIMKQFNGLYTENIDIEYKNNITSNFKVLAIGDEVRFFRVIQNIMNNAVEATGQSNLSIRRILVTNDLSDTSITFTIEDNGPGFPTEIEKDLGQEGATFGKVNGSGLGLYHAVKTLEDFSGAISFSKSQTENYGGAKIIIQLPLVSISADSRIIRPMANKELGL